MKRKQGFTLVELLVVIGIIAMLISILLPSLNGARRQAMLTKCSAQMRGIVQAVILYANDNRGALPPTQGDLGRPTYNVNGVDPGPAPSIIYNTGIGLMFEFRFLASHGGNAWPNTGDKDDWSGLARLMRRKYLPNKPESYRCPGMFAKEDASNYTSIYYFNPHLKAVTVSGGTVVQQFWWKKITNYGKHQGGNMSAVNVRSGATGNFLMQGFRRAILVDPIGNLQNNPHANGSKRSWNFAYPDGSVQTFSSSAVMTDFTPNGWGRFLDISNAMQFAADGNNVDFFAYANKFAIAPLDPR